MDLVAKEEDAHPGGREPAGGPAAGRAPGGAHRRHPSAAGAGPAVARGAAGACSSRCPAGLAAASRSPPPPAGPRALAELVPRLPAGLHAGVRDRPAHAAEIHPAASPSGWRRRAGSAWSRPITARPFLADTAYVAPGDYHMRVVAGPDGPRIELDQEPSVWGVRPAADPLFRSVAALYGARARSAWCSPVWAGTAPTDCGRSTTPAASASPRIGRPSTIYGMPNAALQAGGARHVLPVGQIAGRVADELGRMEKR